MPIIKNSDGVRLFLKDAISYTKANKKSVGKALFYCIFGKKLTTEKAKTFIAKNPKHYLSTRIQEKIEDRSISSTQSDLSTQSTPPNITSQPNAVNQPNPNDEPLYDMILKALTDHKRSTSELAGLDSNGVVDKIREMGIMNTQDWNMINFNKSTTDFSNIIAYEKQKGSDQP